MSKAVKVQGIESPIIREGDNIVEIVVDRVLNEVEEEYIDRIYSGHEQAILGIVDEPELVDEDGDTYVPYKRLGYNLQDKSIIGITESVVARAAGQYITIDDIAADIEKKFGKDATIALINPIYSRNRFSLILKGIAKAAKKVIIVMPEYDEVGNPRGVNPFTGVNIEEYYKELCESENCECVISQFNVDLYIEGNNINILYCGLHDYKSPHIDCVTPISSYNYKILTLADICSDKSPDWGVLGTNKATEDKLKLFPSKAEAQRVCDEVKAKIKEKTGKDVYVMIFGDGHFHSPYLYKENGDVIPGTSINEFADPVAWFSGIDTPIFNSTPNEIKIKNFADDKYKNLRGEELDNAIKNEIKSINKNLKGNMAQMGCTPRHIGDLLATNFDTLVGSGSRGCPVVLMQNYFNNFSN